MANELVVIEQSTALDLFTAPEKVNQMLAHIKTLAEEERKELDGDLSVAKNRKAFASLAYKVTQTKTAIDKAGKLVVDDLKELPKKVDAARKLFRDELDSLSNDIRQPVTDWEIADEARKAAEELARVMPYLHAEALEMNAEHDRLIAEKEAQRIAREEEIKRQAAKQARLEAERKAQQEKQAAELKAQQEIDAAAQREREAKEAQERAEREKQEAIQRAEQATKEAKEKAEQEAKEAQERAEREKQAAIEAERKKAHEAEQARLAEEDRKRQEDAKRQADKKHQKEINNQAMQDLIDAGIPEECAKSCIIAIAKNLVSNVKIHY